MAFEIKFYGQTGSTPVDLGSNGLGLFGNAGFGAPISIGSYNGRTFVTDGAGSNNVAECNNIKFTSLTGCIIGQTGTPHPLNEIPNIQAPLNIRATYDTPIRTFNSYAYVYNRVAVGTPASGVDTYLYEVSHLASGQTPVGSGGPGTPTISGQQGWYKFEAAVATSGMQMTAAPGLSGQRPSGSSTTGTRHDWYLAISATPVSPGTKTNWGFWFDTEWV